MRWLAILGVLVYRVVLRPFYRRVCLFDESCSTYAIRMLRAHGLQHGTPLVIARLRACRMPADACFVLDDHGQARMLAATTWDGSPVAPKAVDLLLPPGASGTRRARRSARWLRCWHCSSSSARVSAR